MRRSGPSSGPRRPMGEGSPAGDKGGMSSGPGGRPKRFQRRKFCRFCAEKIPFIDYKDVRMLRQYVSDRGKITPRRLTGTCANHQRELCTAIKQARTIALMPHLEG